MKMDLVANSKNDEYYTPKYAVTPILKYIKPNSTIWCPFDENWSQYYKTFMENGHYVINTHINHGLNFFECIIPDCDYIISNPPYTLKYEVLNRLFELDIPFAMLVGVVGLFESQKRFKMFADNDFEIMYMNKRVSYFNDKNDEVTTVSPPFSSVYICKDMLPDRIVFETINKSKYVEE